MRTMMGVGVQGASWSVRALSTGGLHMAGTYYGMWAWIFANGEPQQGWVTRVLQNTHSHPFIRF